MSCATLKATTENPPMAPFAKGGGPKDRGIFASNRHFHKRRRDAKGKRKELTSFRQNNVRPNFAPLRLGGSNIRRKLYARL
jgi:hypothetical protein